MLAARGFQKVTSAATMTGVEKDSIVGVTPHLLLMILLCNEGFGHHAFVQ